MRKHRTRNLVPQFRDSGFSPAGCPGMTLVDGGVDQIPQQVADIFALAGALHHEHREQVLGGVDEEERAGHAAPEELTERARERRDASVSTDSEAEAKAMTG